MRWSSCDQVYNAVFEMQIPDDLLQRFALLEEACIDASSVIYMCKSGFFDRVYQALRLSTVPAVAEEVGREADGITLFRPADQTLTSDAQLIQCAYERQLAVISEDKQLLLSAKRLHLPYYNALMMLNWLLFKGLIQQFHYHRYHAALQSCARYSDAVWNYGEAVHRVCRMPRSILPASGVDPLDYCAT